MLCGHKRGGYCFQFRNPWASIYLTINLALTTENNRLPDRRLCKSVDCGFSWWNLLSSQLTDIGVLQVLEEGDLPDGGAGRALLVLQPDLLEGHDGVGQPGLALVHRGVGALKHGTLDKFQFSIDFMRDYKNCIRFPIYCSSNKSRNKIEIFQYCCFAISFQ